MFVSAMELSLPADLSEPLFRVSKSSDLKEALELLIDIARVDDGRADLASKDVLPTVLKLCHSLPSRYLKLSLKLLRNLCAGEFTNQDLFVALKGPETLSAVFRSAGVGSEPDHETSRFGLQVLANVSLAGEQHQQAIWRCFFPGDFVALAKIGSRATCDPLCMIIYTCCDGNHSKFVQLCGDEGLPVVAEIVRTASTVGFGEDWFKLLLSRICLEQVHFPQLFSALCCVGDSGELFSKEQTYLLSVISEILNERLKEITVSIDFASCVFGIFKISTEAVDFVSKGKSGLPTGSTSIDVLGYSLTILRDICAQAHKPELDDDSVDVIGTVLSYGLLELLLLFLRDLEPPTSIKKAMEQNKNQESAPSHSYKSCPYKGFRRDIVAAISNCAFQRMAVQDKIRQMNGILLMLQQCVADEDNPFLREWGIWCMRNLLEGNEENQKAVVELELQGTVDMPELSGLGLRVEVDPNTRRAKLVNVSPTQDKT